MWSTHPKDETHSHQYVCSLSGIKGSCDSTSLPYHDFTHLGDFKMLRYNYNDTLGESRQEQGMILEASPRSHPPLSFPTWFSRQAMIFVNKPRAFSVLAVGSRGHE